MKIEIYNFFQRIFYRLRRIFSYLPGFHWVSRWFKYSPIALVLIIVISFWGFNYLQNNKLTLIKTPIGKVMLDSYRSIRKISDIFYFNYAFKKSDLPIYELKIKPEDWSFLNKNLPEPFVGDRLTNEYRQTVPASFYYQGREYKVKVSYRGWVSNHWANNKKSWDINFKKGDLFNGLDSIKLIIPEDRGIIAEHFNNYRAKKMGLYPLVGSFIVFKINGQNQGLYFQLNPWDNTYLTSNNLIEETDMFAFKDLENNDLPNDTFKNIDYFEKTQEDPQRPKGNFDILNNLIDVLYNTSDDEFKKEIVEILDIDNFLAWQSHYLLSASNHNAFGNIRLFVDGRTGKLVFTPWDVNIYPPNPDLEKNITFLQARISMIPEFAYKRNKIIWDYVNHDSNLKDDLRFYDNIFEQIKVAIAQDSLKVYSTYWFFKKNQENRQLVIDNYQNIKNLLSDDQFLVSLSSGTNRSIYLDITNNSLPEIAISQVFIKNSESIYFKLFFDKNKNKIKDVGDEMIGLSTYNKQCQCQSFDFPREIILSVKKDLPANGEYGPLVYSPQSHRYFIEFSNNNHKIEDLKVGIKNVVTGKFVQPEIDIIKDENK